MLLSEAAYSSFRRVWVSRLELGGISQPKAPGFDPHCPQSNWRFSNPYLLLNDLSLYCLTPTCSLMTRLCTV